MQLTVSYYEGAVLVTRTQTYHDLSGRFTPAIARFVLYSTAGHKCAGFVFCGEYGYRLSLHGQNKVVRSPGQTSARPYRYENWQTELTHVENS